MALLNLGDRTRTLHGQNDDLLEANIHARYKSNNFNCLFFKKTKLHHYQTCRQRIKFRNDIIMQLQEYFKSLRIMSSHSLCTPCTPPPHSPPQKGVGNLISCSIKFSVHHHPFFISAWNLKMQASPIATSSSSTFSGRHSV